MAPCPYLSAWASDIPDIGSCPFCQPSPLDPAYAVCYQPSPAGSPVKGGEWQVPFRPWLMSPLAKREQPLPAPHTQQKSLTVAVHPQKVGPYKLVVAVCAGHGGPLCPELMDSRARHLHCLPVTTGTPGWPASLTLRQTLGLFYPMSVLMDSGRQQPP